MAKIVSNASITITPADGIPVVVSGVLKFKPPGKKADEVKCTVFGDTHRRRMPGRIDYDGITFSAAAPNQTLLALSGKYVSMEINVDYVDGSSGYLGVTGFFSAEASESDVEGSAIESIDCTMAADGEASMEAQFGPATLYGNADANITSALDGTPSDYSVSYDGKTWYLIDSSNGVYTYGDDIDNPTETIEYRE